MVLSQLHRLYNIKWEDVEETVMAYFKILFHHLHGRTEEKYKNTLLEYLASGLRTKSRPSKSGPNVLTIQHNMFSIFP
jgi:hypothetical protein